MSPSRHFLIDHTPFEYDVNLNESTQFTVNAVPRSYTVFWDAHENPFDLIHAKLINSKNVLLIDQKLLSLYQPRFSIPAERQFIFESTELAKSLESVTKVLDFLQKNALTKGEHLIVVGGGITQDIGAFAAALYKRGIPWIYFPTTLLAMCDSCLGGKSSLNYHNAKNQLGLFSKPESIYINPCFLNTLHENDLYSGLGEILKLCIIGGDDYLKLYKNNVVQGKIKSVDAYKKLIFAALSVKKAVIEADEFELHHRQSMNYGHTLGHAIESLSHYTISHGQAIVLGMMLENCFSFQQGLLSKADLNTLHSLCLDLVDQHIIDRLHEIAADSILALVQKDKKTVTGCTNFTLMKSVGDMRFVQCEFKGHQWLAIKNLFVSAQPASACIKKD